MVAPDGQEVREPPDLPEDPEQLDVTETVDDQDPWALRVVPVDEVTLEKVDVTESQDEPVD